MNQSESVTSLRMWIVLTLAVLGMVASGAWIFNAEPALVSTNRAAPSNGTGGTAVTTPPAGRLDLAQSMVTADVEMTQAISAVLRRQVDAWNRGDLDEFMSTYWNSESLTFSSGGSTQRGWQGTLTRYRQRYPAGTMGTLKFDELEITKLTDQFALVLGQWHLSQGDEIKQGNFSLVMRLLGDDWVIIHDHTSLLDKTDEAENAGGEPDSGGGN